MVSECQKPVPQEWLRVENKQLNDQSDSPEHADESADSSSQRFTTIFTGGHTEHVSPQMVTAMSPVIQTASCILVIAG